MVNTFKINTHPYMSRSKFIRNESSLYKLSISEWLGAIPESMGMILEVSGAIPELPAVSGALWSGWE